MYDMKALYEAKSVEDAIRLLQEHPEAQAIAGVDVSDCEFYGFACAVDARPSDGEISVRNNIFSDSDVAVSVDVRLPGSGTNAGMTGKIEDNIFLHCVECSRFSYCGKYEGELDFEDEGIKV